VRENICRVRTWPQVSRRSLQRLTVTGDWHDRQLPDAFGFTDADGTKPECWGDLAAHGW
jgi:hypothetical protein